jgi:hypothetical protein
MHHKDDNLFKAAQAFICTLDHLMVEKQNIDVETLRKALTGRIDSDNSEEAPLSVASLNLRSALVQRYAALMNFTPIN